MKPIDLTATACRKAQTICAWCLQEKGIPAQKGDSHGICARHYAEEMKKMDKEEENGKDD